MSPFKREFCRERAKMVRWKLEYNDDVGIATMHYTRWAEIRRTTEDRVILRQEIRKKFGMTFFYLGLGFRESLFAFVNDLVVRDSVCKHYLLHG